MDRTTLIGLAFHLLTYSALFYFIAIWSWDKQRKEPGLVRACVTGILRIGAGALVHYCLLVSEGSSPMQLRLRSEDLIFIARIMIWIFFLGYFCNARGFRLAAGLFAGMILNLVADFLFPITLHSRFLFV